MQPIEEAEEKEAFRIQAGYEKEAYKTFDKKLDKLCLQESVDRRIIFELIGRKITPEGEFEKPIFRGRVKDHTYANPEIDCLYGTNNSVENLYSVDVKNRKGLSILI